MDAILFSLNESSLNFCEPIFQGADNSANQDRFYAVNALPTNWETISNSHLKNRVEVRLLVRLTRGFLFSSSPILRDPGAVSRVDKMSMVKVYCKIGTSPWALTLTEPVPEAFELPASDWPENSS